MSKIIINENSRFSKIRIKFIKLSILSILIFIGACETKEQAPLGTYKIKILIDCPLRAPFTKIFTEYSRLENTSLWIRHINTDSEYSDSELISSANIIISSTQEIKKIKKNFKDAQEISIGLVPFCLCSLELPTNTAIAHLEIAKFLQKSNFVKLIAENEKTLWGQPQSNLDIFSRLKPSIKTFEINTFEEINLSLKEDVRNFALVPYTMCNTFNGLHAFYVFGANDLNFKDRKTKKNNFEPVEISMLLLAAKEKDTSLNAESLFKFLKSNFYTSTLEVFGIIEKTEHTAT